MLASTRNLGVEKPSSADDWTLVLPRRGKQKRDSHKIVLLKQEEQARSWTPVDVDTNIERESKLLHKMEMYIKRLENSCFWASFLDQLQSTEIFDWFLKVLGAEANMQMVVYGIGSIELFEPPRLQLSLAILLQRKFSWIGDIEVFDPILSLTESKVLRALGCSVLSVNEKGRREALKPTLFFMPHCEAELYDNLLQANWRSDMLKRIALFGNSFSEYEYYASLRKTSAVPDARKHILVVKRFTSEFGIKIDSDEFFQAFQGSSWHFFNLDSEADLVV